jgi:hypothetical protein
MNSESINILTRKQEVLSKEIANKIAEVKLTESMATSRGKIKQRE